MAEETRGYGVSSPSGGCTRGDEDHILDALKEKLLGVVEASSVDRLSCATRPGRHSATERD